MHFCGIVRYVVVVGRHGMDRMVPYGIYIHLLVREGLIFQIRTNNSNYIDTYLDRLQGW